LYEKSRGTFHRSQKGRLVGTSFRLAPDKYRTFKEHQMGIPLQLRALLIVGAAMSALPSLAFADPTQDPATVGERSTMTFPARAAAVPGAPAPGAPAAPALPPPDTLAQANAAAAEGFKDVPTTHWAYPALQQLQADGIVIGYPDGYFRGKRQITRYEIAAITARAIKHVQELLANAATAPHVSPDDIATLRKLIDDNTAQLAAVQYRDLEPSAVSPLLRFARARYVHGSRLSV
jgi:hypothetical protein